MINHYNAFISYKHAPEDNRVAEAVHKGLERFHIPGKLRKKTGFKRIKRIFRDKDELPITNDLSDTISGALENSDYLIVICSTNTKKSAWVPREIEYFLKNHSKRDIFTVLVDGEPYDVIPEILTYEDRVVTDEEGNEKIERVPIEPLSCDYRMGMSKAKKTELPRLVCGIIGCSYDELMNRHRQYRLKQLTACFSIAMAVALSFGGYMYYSRTRIHKNYLESLRNQSKYLANESENLLEKEQRITALQLALFALPKDDKDDRPVTAEAVRALSNATLAYEGNDGININAVWNYQMPNAVEDYAVSDDGKTIALRDTGNIVAVWNTESHERTIYKDDYIDDVIGMAFADDESLLVWTAYKIISYDITTGNEKWDYILEGDSFEDVRNLMLADNGIYIGTVGKNYLQLKLETGEVQNELALPEMAGHEELGLVESKLSPNGKMIAFRGIEGYNSYVYGVMDIASGSAKVSDVQEEMVKNIEWFDNDKLMVATTMADMKGSMSMGAKDIISSDHSHVICVGGTDLAEKWKVDFVCNGVMINSGFVNLTDSSVGYFSGNVISVYDCSTGKECYTNNVNDSIIDVSDKDGDGNPIYITENGGYASPALNVDTDAVFYNRFFADELRQVIINNGVYVRRNLSSEVLYYGVNIYDDNWTPLSDDVQLQDVSDEFVLGNDCFSVISSDENGPVLNTFGLDGDDETIVNRLEGDNIYNYKMLGIRDGVIYLGYDNGTSYDLVTVRGNEVKQDEMFKMTTMFDYACEMTDGRFIYFTQNNNGKKVVVINDSENGEDKEYELPDDAGFISYEPVYYADCNLIYVKGEKECIIDTESGKAVMVDLPDDWGGACCFSDKSQDGKIAVSDGKRILTVDKNGKTVNVVRCPGVAPLGVTFVANEMVVLYNDSGLYCYEVNTGDFIRKSEASVYYGYNGKTMFDYDSANGLLFIQMGRLTDIIDMDSGIEIDNVENSFGHHMGKDIFITSAKSDNNMVKVGYYRRYSVEELMDKAHSILKNAELSDEMKSRYGIE